MLEDDEVSGWKVLIVDDDGGNLKVAEQLFLLFGADVRLARDGVEGLQELEKFAPTFILLDLSMPHLDGWGTLKRIRGNPPTASIPVIALTAHDTLEDTERIKAAGFDGYVIKPYQVTTLLGNIKDILAHRNGSGVHADRNV